MSADNWKECPRCLKRAIAKKEQLEAMVTENYGKVPVEEFDQLRAEAAKPVDIGQHLREDYEFYLDEETGEFYASYKGRCQECDFSFEFKHEEVVPIG